MRTQRRYKVSNESGLVAVAKCSAGLSGSISKIGDTEYRLTQVAAHLLNGGSINELGNSVNRNLNRLKSNVYFTLEKDEEEAE